MLRTTSYVHTQQAASCLMWHAIAEHDMCQAAYVLCCSVNVNTGMLMWLTAVCVKATLHSVVALLFLLMLTSTHHAPLSVCLVLPGR